MMISRKIMVFGRKFKKFGKKSFSSEKKNVHKSCRSAHNWPLWFRLIPVKTPFPCCSGTEILGYFSVFQMFFFSKVIFRQSDSVPPDLYLAIVSLIFSPSSSSFSLSLGPSDCAMSQCFVMFLRRTCDLYSFSDRRRQWSEIDIKQSKTQKWWGIWIYFAFWQGKLNISDWKSEGISFQKSEGISFNGTERKDEKFSGNLELKFQKLTLQL